MAISKERLRGVLAGAGRPLGVKELLRACGLHPGQQTELKRALRELLREGELEKEGKRFSTRRPGASTGSARTRETGAPRAGERRKGDLVEGVLSVHRDGFGFVQPASGEREGIFIPPADAARGLDNDRVRVQLYQSRGRTVGRIVEVVERRRQQLVGTYVERGRHSYVAPHDPSVPGPVRVPATQLARDGDLVRVTLGVGAELVSPGEGLVGEVAGSLGRPGDPSGEVLGIAFSQGFSDEFPPEAMEEADRIPLQVAPEELEGRRDLRGLSLVTIDGEDARDFDDAVYAEDRPHGWRLVVAIADVSHYVRERTPLDREAARRATSVYLPGRVLPMLPERLSNGICSLRPGEDRLCLVADMEIDRRGKTGRYELYPAVMRSAARCTYGEVQAVLDGKDVPHRNAFRAQFERLMALARVLTKMRMARGAIDFELPEVRVVLGEGSEQPVRLERRERLDAHRLVEECMLAANEAVAHHFLERDEPTVYRYHAEPDEERLETFATLARAHGFALPSREKLTSKALADFLERLEGHPEERALNQLLLRSMMQAVYSAENVGHYGLAAAHYLHFTSPIRRYPDLLVHRGLKRLWARGGAPMTGDQRESETDRLEGLAVQCSERERAAMQVEREVHAYYAALLMKDRVGEEFGGTVAAVTDFGFFVELDEEMVEGLVHAEALGPGARFDEATRALVFPNGRRVRVGQKLRVRVESVNVLRRQIDLWPVAFEGEEALPERAPAWRERGPRRREEAARMQPEETAALFGALPELEPRPKASAHAGFDRRRAAAAKHAQKGHGRGLFERKRPGGKRGGGKHGSGGRHGPGGPRRRR